jgi:hypothetical protein
MARAMVTAEEIDAAAGYQPTRAGRQPSVRPGRLITPRLDAWRMQTSEVKGNLSLRSRSRCRWGSGGDLLRIGPRSGRPGPAT